MKISIVLATYNGAAHIREQLDSIAAQTVAPDEIIVGDDGSTDDTLAIIREFAAGTEVPVVITEKSERLGFADNFLWTAERSRYELVAFCDQDDRWHPHKLEEAKRRIVQDDSLLALHTLTITDARLTPTGQIWRQGIEGDRMFKPLELDPHVTGWGNSMLFRRELLFVHPRQARPRHPHAVGHPPAAGRLLSHDTWIYVLAAALGRVSHIAEPLLLYRQHASNTAGLTITKYWRLQKFRQMGVVPIENLREQAEFHKAMVGVFGRVAAGDGAFTAAAAAAAAEFGKRHALSSARASVFDAPTVNARFRAFRAVLRLSKPNRDLLRSRVKALVMGVGGLIRVLPFLVQRST